MDQRIFQKFIMSLVVMTTLTSAVSLERRGRHLGTITESSHTSKWTNLNSTRPLKEQISVQRDKNDTLWDDGILMSSAGNGKERKTTDKTDDDDEKKTLSQQVKEGKYGLIQSELYSKEPKRPGIISYLPNSEVPNDTAKTLGGLDKDEIWMAENHLLVLRGGNFPKDDTENRDSETAWPPIDDYEAPRRQVKIPKDPKVPPPFPVQLSEGGAIQLIGNNGTGSQDNGTMDYEYLSASRGFLPGEGPFFSIPSGDSYASPNFVKSINNSRGGDDSRFPDKKGKSEPPPDLPISFFPALPPGAVFVPPPSNMSDYDEDDQSIFYPMPYSFVFPQDNTTAIPPGPLVPGIILPPPPDFFSSLDEKKPTVKSKLSRPTTTTTPPSKSRTSYFTSRKTNTKLYKTTTATTQSPVKTGTLPISKTKLKNVTEKPFFVEVTTPAVQIPPQSVTSRPAIENTIETSTEKNRWSSVVNSKNIPLTAYYATTIPSSVEATPASIKTILTTKHSARIPSKASYYFYEEATEKPSTMNPSYYRTTTVLPFIKTKTLPPEQERKKYYKVEMISSRPTAKDISVKLINSIVKDPQVYQYTEAEQPKNLKENISEDPGTIFYETVPNRYYTTPRPNSYYREDSNPKAERKPKPIYQYSFEAAGYYKPEKQKQKELGSFNQFQDIQTVSDQYDYETEGLPEQQIRTERIPEKNPLEPLNSDRREPSSKIPFERIPSARIPYKQSYYQTTLSPYSDSTMDPHQAYFTKQDEQLLDDVTKEYFTAFGKKLTNKAQSTTPIYGKSSTVTEKPKYNTFVQNHFDLRQFKSPTVKVHYGDDQSQSPFSLKDDTLVNYNHPLPPINPDSEFINVNSPPVSLKSDILVNYRNPRLPINPDSEFINVDSQSVSQEFQNIIPAENQVRDYRPQPMRAQLRNYGSQRVQKIRGESDFLPIGNWNKYPRPVSLEGDIAVNYRNPRPPINPDAEFIGPVQNSESVKANSYIAYTLPGDVGHVYFLTPQANPPRQEDRDNNLYTKPRSSRFLRRRRGPGSNV